MQITRYAANGVAATAVHYSALYICVEIIEFQLIGAANLFASTFGILASFLGNKYFVFNSNHGRAHAQLLKFIAFYVLIAVIHGAILLVWSDVYQLNYNHGFALAVTIQFLLGYLVSKYLIFNQKITMVRGASGRV